MREIDPVGQMYRLLGPHLGHMLPKAAPRVRHQIDLADKLTLAIGCGGGVLGVTGVVVGELIDSQPVWQRVQPERLVHALDADYIHDTEPGGAGLAQHVW